MKPALAARLKKACQLAAIALVGIGYPVLSHLVSSSPTPSLLGAVVAIAPLAGLALVMAWRSSQRTAMLALCLLGVLVLHATSDWLVTHYNWVFLLQHAGTYGLLCLAFGRTLQDGQTPMISRFARTIHGELSPALVSYTRAATWAWTLYFGGISSLSMILFWLAPVHVWSTFANLLGLPLLILMFAGEYAARCHFLPAHDRAGPIEAIRAYRQASSDGSARTR